MVRISVFLFLFLFQVSFIYSQVQSTKQYLLYLDTKDYEEFASKRQINQGNISLNDSLDCPIKRLYFSILAKNNINVIGHSKWLNAIAISIDESQDIDNIKNLPFILKYEYLSEIKDIKNENSIQDNLKTTFSETLKPETQLKMENGTYLHENGFKGKGITIAILDGGFSGADTNIAFMKLRMEDRIKYTYDFVEEDNNPFHGSDHGANCFSIMAAQKPSNLLGSAPDANYILLRTEDTKSEQKIEEFNLVRGLELADSLGAKIVNISLGYYKFDNNLGSYNWESLTKQESISQIGVELAAKKGILVVVSAGNEGDEQWRYLGFPANAAGALTVGSVDNSGMHSYFSSEGYPNQTIIKPDLVAMGEDVFLREIDDEIEIGNGTSYACPIIAGLSACLWQAFPALKAEDIIEILQKSGDQYFQPDRLKGYGLPNYKTAFFLASRKIFNTPIPTQWTILPNQYEAELFLFVPNTSQNGALNVTNGIGKNIYHKKIEQATQFIYDISDVSSIPGFYISTIVTNKAVIHQKLIKR
jgi:serine protease AprX